MRTKLVLDFDDFHWKEPENCLESIDKLIQIIPHIKLSLFTVPKHSNIPIESNKIWCNKVKILIEKGTIRLGHHGLTHDYLEFAKLNKIDSIKRLNQAQMYFDRAGLPIAKVFKGPNWGINQQVYDALADFGFTHVYSHQDYKLLGHSNIKTVFYNWNLKDPEPPKEEVIIAHGHSWNVCDNGIQEVMYKIITFIKNNNPQLFFIDEI